MFLNYEDSEKLMKQIKEDLKHPVGLIPTPKLQLVVEKIRKNNSSEKINKTNTEDNEYNVEKIKRKLNMFLKTNDLQYLEKVLYLTKELIKDNK